MAIIRITDQYFWNVVFGLFFLVLLVLAVIILETESFKTVAELTLLDFVLMTLATMRLVRLFVYDTMTKVIREQCYDVVKGEGGMELIKPKVGPRRTLAELLSCPWCFGLWAGASVSFFYLLTPLAFFPVLILAISGVASYLQIVANLTGHKADEQKSKNERGF